MARKKPPEEHENLERWLVSYADFMTLLFATFVVLYALSQSDIDSFKNIEEALRKAFSQNIFDNQTSIMEGSDSIFQGENGAMNPLMLEYMSQKYEQSSYEDIKDSINSLNQEGLSAEIDPRGLVIKLNSYAIQFSSGGAELNQKSYDILDKVAQLIKEKFSIHYIQVEGHTDSDKIGSNLKYPSNWELSGARASSVVRYLINKHSFNSKLFSAVGLADTVPLVPNTSAANKAKNRRVEIVILRNKNKNLSQKNMQEILKEAQFLRQNKKYTNPSKAIEGLVGNDKELLKNVIDMSEQYENENKRLDTLDNDYMHDGNMPDFMEQKNGTK